MTNNNPSSTPSSYHLTFDYGRYNNRLLYLNYFVCNETNTETMLTCIKYYNKIASEKFLGEDSRKVIDSIKSGELPYNDKDSIVFIRDEYLGDIKANYEKIVEDSLMMLDYRLSKTTFKVFNKFHYSNMKPSVQLRILEVMLEDIISKYPIHLD
jgi:hypothetical protein